MKKANLKRKIEAKIKKKNALKASNEARKLLGKKLKRQGGRTR